MVVTGGGDGIGAMVVRRLASEGWSVCVADIDETSATAIAADLTDRGHRVIGVGADVSCEADVERIGEVAETELGALSGWINNAGNTSPSMLLKMEVDAFDSVLAVHARGSFLGVREAARRMVRSESGGAIINVTSSAGLGGTVGQINYASAKGAIIAMTKSAAKELGRYNIRVNAVAPSASTEMTRTIMTNEKFAKTYLSRIALGRFAEADEMSATFSFLLSDDAGYMTGQVLSIDGGTYMVS
ncbi:SDR family NAD(P)-dependent oxidoreductase [Nocardioides marinisabuli]|uniref:SDR family NAD(P)-dependent oxidoreductase n=1 Tax=Nocardioides marinisabuli TaxID=419476 RepID=UPI0015DDA2B0|nr:SDR family NAD(P)-dependent oxidoreductase [Nocardioides marinisabuli]